MTWRATSGGPYRSDGGVTWRAVRDLEPAGRTIHTLRRRRRGHLRRRGLLAAHSLHQHRGSHGGASSTSTATSAAAAAAAARGASQSNAEAARGGGGGAAARTAAQALAAGDASTLEARTTESVARTAEADSAAAEAATEAAARAAAAAAVEQPLVTLGKVSIDGRLIGPHGTGITPGMVGGAAKQWVAPLPVPMPRPEERHGGVPRATHYYRVDTGGGSDAPFRHRGEFSYPSLAQTTDGSIHIVYSVLREAVQYARVHESWIAAGPPSVGAFRGDYYVEEDTEPQQAGSGGSGGGGVGGGGGGADGGDGSEGADEDVVVNDGWHHSGAGGGAAAAGGGGAGEAWHDEAAMLNARQD